MDKDIKIILTNYIKNKFNFNIVHIEYYTINNVMCYVKYYTSNINNNNKTYPNVVSINLWDIMIFLYKANIKDE